MVIVLKLILVEENLKAKYLKVSTWKYWQSEACLLIIKFLQLSQNSIRLGEVIT